MLTQNDNPEVAENFNDLHQFVYRITVI